MIEPRGLRYCRFAGLKEFVVTKLMALDYPEAQEFYSGLKSNPKVTWEDLAFIGCNDRFFMLTALLNRADANHPWLYDRCREVQLEPDGFLDLWAREHYKSTVITFAGVIQEIMCDPELTVGIFSHQKVNAQAFLKQIMQEFEANETLRKAYPDVLWEKPRVDAPRWSLQSGIVVQRKSNPKEATIEATGLIDGQPIGKHYALMVYDDVVTDKSVTNPEQVKRTTEAWELSDNLGAGEVRKWHIGTRYSFGDTYGLIIERGALKPRIYPATDNGKIDGKPVFMSERRWQEKVKTQRSTLSAQMLQNPIAGQENVFKPEWFRRWEIRPQHLSVYIMGDPSGGRTKGSDRTALAVVGIDSSGNKYFLDGFRHRMSLTERWQAVKLLYRKWSNERGIMHVGVGYEKYGLQSDLEYFQERMREENAFFNIEEINWPRQGDHSKRARVERLEPDVRRGTFYFPATIYEPGKGECYWHVSDQHQTIVKLPAKGLTKAQDRMQKSGLDHLICKPIRRLDEDRKPYDVTMALIEEMLFFPFAPKDDMVDATSRIYDMDTIIPSYFEEREAEQINSLDWSDA
jgi:hypothetical protein